MSAYELQLLAENKKLRKRMAEMEVAVETIIETTQGWMSQCSCGVSSNLKELMEPFKKNI